MLYLVDTETKRVTPLPSDLARLNLTAEEYIAVDSRGKVLYGPGNDYEEAKKVAKKSGGYVKYVMEAREQVSVASEVLGAAEAGGFSTMERDPEEIDAGHALGKVTDAKSVYEIMAPLYAKESQEVFVVIPLDIHQFPLCRPVEVGRGPRDQVQVDEQMVLAPVISKKASSFVIAHCHPSTKAEPSPADKKLTKRLKDAAAVACPGVPMVDHVVIGSSSKGGEFYSFNERKLYRVSH